MLQITYFIMRKIICLLVFLSISLLAFTQQDSLPVNVSPGNIADTLRPETIKLSGKKIAGTATIYSDARDGTKTASGEVFFNIRLTAASNDFKLNSWVKVTNTKNRKYVIVRINDRMSANQRTKGVVISLSQEAGKSIGIQKNINKVKVESLIVLDSLLITSNESIYVEPVLLPGPDSLTPNTFKPIGNALNGTASFYHNSFEGRKTATGDIFRNKKLTAASNNFKLNTWVLVTNLRNKKSVIVRINDRMHPRMAKKGRVVDLSREAAKLLDFIDNGLAKVKAQPVKFIFSPVVKQQLDSLSIATDSARLIDSLKTDLPERDEHLVTGIAGVYSADFDGKQTATGEIFSNSKMSAASNRFDLNTWVRVTNLRNNKSVILNINDRMEDKMKKAGRVVYLSRIAAKKLDFVKTRPTKVKVEIVSRDTIE